MAGHHRPSALILGIVLACCMPLQKPCLAQDNSNVSAPPEPKTDATECRDLNVLPKLVSSVMVSCHSGDDVEVRMPLKPDAQGLSQEKTVRGGYEYREYQITQEDQQAHAFEDLVGWVAINGFAIKYSAEPSTITARNGDAWVLINVSGEFYNVSLVRVKEEPWTPPFKDAEEISRGMDANHRVAIYGLAFSTNSQAAYQENEKILGEILKYLNNHPGLSVVVESHKHSEKGTAEGDLEITRKRAAAVVDWLETHGIAQSRLQPKALGRTQPLTENATPREVHLNERIELVKAL